MRFEKELRAMKAIYRACEHYLATEGEEPLEPNEARTLAKIFVTADSLANLLDTYASDEAREEYESTDTLNQLIPDIETYAGVVVSEINVMNGGKFLRLAGFDSDEWTWADDPRA